MVKRHRSLTLFGANVRRARQRAKLTQETLAAAADLDPTYISGIERGVRNPSLLSIIRLAHALRTTTTALSRNIDG